jgi:hypothetical protein
VKIHDWALEETLSAVVMQVGPYPIVTLQYSSITSYQVSYHHIQLLFF